MIYDASRVIENELPLESLLKRVTLYTHFQFSQTKHFFQNRVALYASRNFLDQTNFILATL